MIKKIYFILLLSILISSCGKKGDPLYREQKSGDLDTKLKVVL